MSSAGHQDLDRATRLALVVLAVVQSIALLLLYEAWRHEVWPATDVPWLYALYVNALGLPLFFYLGALRWHDRANGAVAALVALALFWLGWHTGWVAEPFVGERPGSAFAIGFQMVVCVLLAVFIGAFLFRVWRESGSHGVSYVRLLDVSWVNALTLAFLGLFVGVFWLMLTLWAALFFVVGIGFFAELFRMAEFIYPVTGLVGGLGLVVIRARVPLIATVRGMCEALIRALLPLAAFIVVIFLAALPFIGVQPLWDTGLASALLIALTIVLLFFFNAELGDEREARYPLPLRWLLHAAMVLVPIDVGLAAWALGLRVAQYGWTVDRCWALFVIVVLAAYAVGYAVLIVRHRGLHRLALGRWNTGLAVALIAALVLVNTGVLDFRRLAAADQVARLESGTVSAEQLDVTYLRFDLGRYGIDALQALAAGAQAREQPRLATRIDEAMRMENPWATLVDVPTGDVEALRARFWTSGDAEPPAGLLSSIAKHPAVRGRCLSADEPCRIELLDVGGERWWMIFGMPDTRHWIGFSLLIRPSADGTQWLVPGSLGRRQCPEAWRDEAATDSPVLLKEPVWFLRLGRCAYQVQVLLEPQPLLP